LEKTRAAAGAFCPDWPAAGAYWPDRPAAGVFCPDRPEAGAFCPDRPEAGAFCPDRPAPTNLICRDEANLHVTLSVGFIREFLEPCIVKKVLIIQKPKQ